jgi:hypothetical protein
VYFVTRKLSVSLCLRFRAPLCTNVRTDRAHFLIRLQIHRAELATPCTRNYTSRVRWEQRQVFSWASALNQQTRKPPWSALRAVCLHLREISQPLSSTAVRTELPATCGPSITCVSISGWLATATSDAGVRRAAIRRTGCCPAAGALTSAMFSAICTWTAFCKLCVQSVPRAARLLRPV